MNRCISTLGCPDLSLEDALVLAGKYAIDAVELRSLAGGWDLPAYLNEHYAGPAELAAALSRHRPRVFALDTSFALLGQASAARKALLDHVPWAEAAGIRWLRVFDGTVPAASRAASVEAAGAVLDWWAERRQQQGWQVDLMMETHDTFTTAERLVELLQRCPRLHLLWDAHNCWRKGGEDPLAVWSAIGTHVVHVHVKDSVSAPSSRSGYTYVLPGQGEFPMRALRERLSVDGYEGHLSLEWERLWHPELAPLEDALKAAAASAWW